MPSGPDSLFAGRSGISFGGTDGVNCAVGIGIHTGAFDFDLATENLGWIFTPNSAAYGSLAVGMLVPLDGDEEHEQGITVAVDFARLCESTLHLLVVVRTPGTLSGERARSSPRP